MNPGAVYVGTAPRNSANYTTGQVAASATKAFYFLATETTTYVSMLPWNAGAEYCDFNNITVKQLAGNHRYQPTSANRPTWSARYSSFTKTEALGHSDWVKYESTVDSTKYTAPDGTLTAQKLLATTANNNHYIR